ncbi:LysM domain-containing protein [Arthrobacter sp. NPDC080031]|uniref:LysM peptidoglycan-binding domain-containing protein n=1 Tax=Arthrobacter sp. NPDC080031 TaxID=3155918 RepID=UPI00344FEA88
MYQQEYRHSGISGGNVLALISAGVRTLTRYKASIATWAIVALVAVAAVTMQNHAQALAPAGTSAAIAPHVGSGAGIAAPSPAAASPTPAATQVPVQSQAPAAVAPSAPAAAPAAVAAPPAPAPAPAPAAAPDTNAYTVVSGDTVGSIAARFGVDVNGMLAANGLSAYSVIVPGQVLKLTGPPVAAAPAPAPAPAPVPVPAPAPAPAPAVRTIYVAGSGGQAAVDSCIGPIHFTPTDAYSLFITEHDFCGGWARFSGIGVGETVSIPGYGTYTVTARGQVPQGGTTNNVAAVFGGFPRAVLQTCIPGTNQMLVIALN